MRPASASSSSTVTPSQAASNLLHFVMQGKSRVTLLIGKRMKSAHDQRLPGRGPTFNSKRPGFMRDLRSRASRQHQTISSDELPWRQPTCLHRADPSGR